MKEIIVLSGKGGSGKTSFLSSLIATLDEQICLVDCDVDAANLNLVFQGERKENHEFFGGKSYEIDPARCAACGICAEKCHFDAIRSVMVEPSLGQLTYQIDPFACEGCGLCEHICPAGAVTSEPEKTGEYYVSETSYGRIVHAELMPGAENSGRLVAMVREKAQNVAENENCPLVMIDGPPGIGCPVISAVTGTQLALLVTEPTYSGLHDLKRILDLTRHFRVPALVIINKSDLNPEITAEIYEAAAAVESKVIAELKYDTQITRGIMAQPFSFENLPEHWRNAIIDCRDAIKSYL